jgi:hypothetical protein
MDGKRCKPTINMEIPIAKCGKITKNMDIMRVNGCST